MFDNIYLILIIETIFGIYLLDNYLSVRNKQDGNIYESWQKRYEKIKSEENKKSFFDFVFKKHGNLHAQDKIEIRDDFVLFMNDLSLFFKTFCLIFTSFLALYLLFRILSKFLLKLFSPKQNHHVLTPGKYSPTQNAGDWLDTFELFLDEGKVTSNAEKCAAFLSRMEGGVSKTLLNYNRNVKTNYNALKDAFIKIYGTKQRTYQEYNFEFLNCNQEGMNLYHYHAELCKLAKKAFPNCSEAQRHDLIHNRFISGLNNDLLRGQLLASYKTDGVFSKVFGGRSVLDRAADLEDIYGTRQFDTSINMAKNAKVDVICYKCKGKGHYASECPSKVQDQDGNGNQTSKTATNENNQKQSKHQTQNSSYNRTPQTSQNRQQQQANTNYFCLNKVSYASAITGYCKFEGVQTQFMFDTGATKTVIDARLLTSDQLGEIQASPYCVILADGSRIPVLGTRKCRIQLADWTTEMEVLVTERLHEGCLLGIDFLSECPTTKDLIDQLREVAGDTRKCFNVNEVHTFLKSQNTSQ